MPEELAGLDEVWTVVELFVLAEPEALVSVAGESGGAELGSSGILGVVESLDAVCAVEVVGTWASLAALLVASELAGSWLRSPEAWVLVPKSSAQAPAWHSMPDRQSE